jgi:hypothetical protein
MNPDTLIQRGNAGYSKQQKQLRDAKPVQAPVTPVSPAKQYNAGGGVINPYGTSPIVSPNAPITSATMAPSTPVTLPTQIQPTAAAGMAGAIESSNKSVLTEQQKQDALVAEQSKIAETSQGSMDKALERMMGINTEASQAASTIDRTAEDAARQRSDDLVSQMEANSLAARRRVEELQKNNPQGLFGGALQDEVNRINRDNEIQNADLAVQQLAALRSYERLNAIADRQLELKLEPLRLEAKNMELFYNANKDRFNKSDDRVFAAAKEKAEQEYKKAEAVETALTNAKVTLLRSAAEQGAPSSIQNAIQNAKTPEQAILAAGQYGGDMLARKIKLQTIDKNDLEMDKLAQEIRKSKEELNVATVPGSQIGTVQTLLNSAKYDKFADEKTKDKISKSGLIVDQLGDLQSSIAKQGATGLVTGRLAKFTSLLGANANAGLVQAQLTALVPQLARGTYGEVGVLTEPDTQAYRNTLPNLTSDKEKNDLVLAMTLNVVGKSLKNTLETEATNGVNVSGNIKKYNEIMAKKAEIEDRIGVTKNKLFAIGAENPQYQPMIKEMLATGAKPSDILAALGAND